MNKKISLTQYCILTVVVFLLIGVVFYAIAHEQLCSKAESTDCVAATINSGELLSGDVLEQQFVVNSDYLRDFSILFQTFARENTGFVSVSLASAEKTVYETTIDVSGIEDGAFRSFPVNLSTLPGQILTLRIVSEDGTPGNAVSLLFGEADATVQKNMPVEMNGSLLYNGKTLNGELCVKTTTIRQLWFGNHFWQIWGLLTLALIIYLRRLLICEKRNMPCYGLHFINAVTRYRFLISQLVSREFKTKYKRSMLGVLWSFLNPLLTMLVQYVVFSTLFRSNIPNYPVYLLSGIVCFSYYTDTVNQCMGSITSNAALINKVYVPKYIYPLSRALSSCINLLLSLIPLFLVILLTEQKLSWAALLIPFALICLFLFSLGIGMLLSSAMVFFRDTQFLWGVVSMLWMYMTPIFYPETIIPAKFMTFYKLNPLYHIIRFFRCILINGVSPEPQAYLFCIIACAVPLFLGVYVFKKTQDRFVLYI